MQLGAYLKLNAHQWLYSHVTRRCKRGQRNSSVVQAAQGESGLLMPLQSWQLLLSSWIIMVALQCSGNVVSTTQRNRLVGCGAPALGPSWHQLQRTQAAGLPCPHQQHRAARGLT